MIRAVVEQHAEDAAFLWTLRCHSLGRSSGSLADLEQNDERIEANLDGLRIAGAAGERVALAALHGGETGEVFVAAVLALTSPREAMLSKLLDSAPQDALGEGLAGAVEWLPPSKVDSAIERLRRAPSNATQRALLAAHVAHGVDGRATLHAALLADDPSLVGAALRAIGALGQRDLSPALRAGLDSSERASRFAAAWSATLLGDPTARATLRAMAEHASDLAESAASVAVLGLDPTEAASWVDALTKSAAHRRVAIRAVAALGDPRFLDSLLEWLDDARVARLAADAITTLTGMAIAGELSMPPPIASSDEDDADSDEHLAWPSPDAVRAACADIRIRLQPATRYVLGRPATPGFLREALLRGRHPERARAAFELARGGARLFDTSAPFPRQERALAAIGA